MNDLIGEEGWIRTLLAVENKELNGFQLPHDPPDPLESRVLLLASGPAAYAFAASPGALSQRTGLVNVIRANGGACYSLASIALMDASVPASRHHFLSSSFPPRSRCIECSLTYVATASPSASLTATVLG